MDEHILQLCSLRKFLEEMQPNHPPKQNRILRKELPRDMFKFGSGC